jgi:hypothetical protein
MKCYEVENPTMTYGDRLKGHTVNMRHFGKCPVCDAMDSMEDKLPQTRKVIREGLFNFNWRFWK